MGEHIIDHHNEKTKDSMQTLEDVLYHLIDQAILITRHQEYQRVNMSLFLTSRGTICNKLHIPEALPTHLTFGFFFPRRKRRDFDTSVRTPTAKCCGGPWCRPPFCCLWDSGRSNVSKISSFLKSLSRILLQRYNSACACLD